MGTTDMKATNDATRVTAEAMPESPDRSEIGDAVDVLNRAWSQVELINMAAEAGTVTGEAGNAISWGCISVQELLDQVKTILRPGEQEGGAA
jgi:hypothetical protein